MQKAIAIFDEQLNKAARLCRRPTLLLHACCAPCLSSVIERVSGVFDVTVFFCNSNIAPEKEYVRRRDEVLYFLKSAGLNNKFVEAAYNRGRFKTAVSGRENDPERGERCAICIEMRLAQTARYAKAHNFDYFATTLTVSPHKDADMINKTGAAHSGDSEYLFSDFKKRDGYLNSLKLSEKYGLYRQDYCGCSPREHNDGGEKTKNERCKDKN